MNFLFELPGFLLVIPLGLFAVVKLLRQKSAIGFSSNNLLQGIRVGRNLLRIEKLLLASFVITVSLILARPMRMEKTAVPIYQEARDITIVLDNSGSMREGSGQPKMRAAVRVISDFISGRPQDRIALFAFDTRAYLEWPLSSDHETIIYRLNHIGRGGGTVIGAGIIAGLEHQQQFGQNSGAVILVSDGASLLTEPEREEIYDALGETRLYWIWIKSPSTPDLADQFGAYVQSIGGQVLTGTADELEQIFNEISQLESSPVVWENQITTYYHYGILPLVALFSLFGAGLVNLFREV